MKKSLKTICFMIIIVFSLNACNESKVHAPVEEWLVTNGVSFGLGGDDPDKTVVSYNLNLWNNSEKDIILKEIEPIINAEVIIRVLDTSIKKKEDTIIKGGTSETIEGHFTIDTKGLDKKEIIQLNIDIESFRITTEQEISMN